jgi:Na+-transporting NADH:ubiquinone oxidoreductase subunit NqrC
MEDSRGSTVILALSILIITSIMAGAALRVVSVQSKVAQAHKQMEMLNYNLILYLEASIHLCMVFFVFVNKSAQKER